MDGDTSGFSPRVQELLAAQRKTEGLPARAPQSSTGTALAAPSRPYSPDALLALIIEEPGRSHSYYAAAFGRNAAWFASVLASNAFQSRLDTCRDMIADPSISGTLEERFRALAVQSLNVLQAKMDGKEVSDFLVTKAVDLSVKALGMGQFAAPVTPQEAAPTGAEAVAERIMAAMAKQRAAARNAEAVDVVAKEVPSGD